MNYASGTVVTERESRTELVGLLERHECSDVQCGLNQKGAAVVKFTYRGRMVRLLVPMPESGNRERPRRWRVLILLLKAKLEAVSSGISTFDAEFLSYIAMPGGVTVGQMMATKVSEAYEAGRVLAEAR